MTAEELLAKAFGADWANLTQSTGDPNDPGTIIGALLMVFNVAILTGTALIVLWTLLVGTMETAHHGETLGKRYSTLWAPIRSVLGIALVTPAVGGFSMLQIAMLMVISVSVGVANKMWTAGIEFIADRGGLVPPVVEVDKSLPGHILSVLTCAEYMKKEDGNTLNLNVSTSSTEEVYITTHSYSMRGSNAYSTPTGRNVCGSVKLTCPQAGAGASATERAGQLACEAHAQGLSAMITRLQPIAQQLVDDEQVTDNAIGQSVLDYNEKLEIGMDSAFDELTNNRDQYTDDFIDRATNQGFLMAGSWYFTLSQMNKEISKAVRVNIERSGIKTDRVPNFEEGLQPVLVKADAYIKSEHNPDLVAGTAAEKTDREVAQLGNKIWNPIRNLHTYLYSLNATDDPIAQLQGYGDAILTANGVVISLYVSAKTLSKSAEKVADSMSWVPFIGQVTSGGAGVMSGALEGITPLILAAIFSLFVLGGLLAYYIPAIPFIMWTMGIVGWMVMIFESLIASSLWGAAHAHPEGEGLTGQSAKQGYLLFLNVLVRPMLLVFGLFAGMLVMMGASYITIQGFSTFSGALQAENFTIIGVYEFIFLSAIITGLLITVIHKSHAMIYTTADNVMHWIGAGGPSHGEAEGESRTSGAFAAANQGVAGFNKTAVEESKEGNKKPGSAGEGGAGDEGSSSGGGTTKNKAAEKDLQSADVSGAQGAGPAGEGGTSDSSFSSGSDSSNKKAAERDFQAGDQSP
jgi:conjugal transfer/type IV secretion protein DotA/TraY